MKLSKTLLQTIAVAVAVVATGACKDKTVKPKGEKTEQKQPYNCPACGLG